MMRFETLPESRSLLLFSKEGKKTSRGETVGFIKVHPFKTEGRQFTVKPTSQTNLKEVNVDEYVRNLISSLSQTFEPMGIKLDTAEADLSEFM